MMSQMQILAICAVVTLALTFSTNVDMAGKAMDFSQCKFLACAEVARFGLTQHARLRALAHITFQLRNAGEGLGHYSSSQMKYSNGKTLRSTL